MPKPPVMMDAPDSPEAPVQKRRNIITADEMYFIPSSLWNFNKLLCYKKASPYYKDWDALDAIVLIYTNDRPTFWAFWF